MKDRDKFEINLDVNELIQSPCKVIILLGTKTKPNKNNIYALLLNTNLKPTYVA